MSTPDGSSGHAHESTQHEETTEGTRDPFGIDRLSVDYDYLLYRIQDHVTSIQLSTTEICRQQNQLVEQGIIKDAIDVNIEEMHRMLQKCEELEAHFDMLDQIDGIVQAFRPRLDAIVREHRELTRSTERKI
ncbi:LAQU0S04e01002g1_1 [Lachancea quebecensis]|uniref:Biogenesis of lysosome-related organelles complex 1 subunit CNL1 n=1 Tax=Lachancea quebecensis TaxID=1654605 RepID=A0A0P1KPD3_9SACH|nr:LAQU0S04e01002g1_1 [Lachancea quebecensis]